MSPDTPRGQAGTRDDRPNQPARAGHHERRRPRPRGARSVRRAPGQGREPPIWPGYQTIPPGRAARPAAPDPGSADAHGGAPSLMPTGAVRRRALPGAPGPPMRRCCWRPSWPRPAWLSPSVVGARQIALGGTDPGRSQLPAARQCRRRGARRAGVGRPAPAAGDRRGRRRRGGPGPRMPGAASAVDAGARGARLHDRRGPPASDVPAVTSAPASRPRAGLRAPGRHGRLGPGGLQGTVSAIGMAA